jgi:hypothetical protein
VCTCARVHVCTCARVVWLCQKRALRRSLPPAAPSMSPVSSSMIEIATGEQNDGLIGGLIPVLIPALTIRNLCKYY